MSEIFNPVGGLDLEPPITTLTPGSVLFAGATGLIDEDPLVFFWKKDTDNFMVGTNTLGGGIGSTTADGIFLNRVQNFTSEIVVRNTNAGAFASAQFAAKNGTSLCQYGVTGTGYVVAGDILAANEGYLYTSLAAGIYIGSPDSIYIRLVTDDVERLRISSTGVLTINEDGISTADVRMEGDTDANAYFLQASTDRVGFGTATPAGKVDVSGTFAVSGTVFLEADRDVAVSLLPNASATLDLGSTSRRWNAGWITTLTLTNALAVTSGGTGLATVAQGDLLYGSAANTLSALAKDANATRYLSNTGASNNPAWAQVNLANGVTGTLPVGNGGTGTATTFTLGSVIFAGASGVYTQDNTNFFWDDTNNFLGIGTNAPAARLHAQAATAGLLRLTCTGEDRVNIATIRDDASPTAADDLAQWEIYGRDSAANLQVYGDMKWSIVDPTSTSEDSSFNMRTILGGTMKSRIQANFDNVIFNDDAADIDAAFEGTSDAQLLYTDAGNNRVGVGTSTPAGRFQVSGRVTTEVTTITRAVAAQTAALAEWQKSSGTVLASINSDGNYTTTRGGGDNLLAGTNAGDALTTGATNILLGTSAGLAITSGSQNIAIGFDALKTATTATTNVAIGHSAGKVCTVSDNVFIGSSAGIATTTGTFNVMIGTGAGQANTTGGDNFMLGANAGATNTTGAQNTYIGTIAGYASNGDANTAIGYVSMFTMTSGAFNTAIGYNTGNTITDGYSNVFIGFSADGKASGTFSSVAIGAGAVAASNEFGIGPDINFMTLYGTSSTPATRQRADWTVSWVDSTDASRKARIVHNVWDTAAREYLRGEASGSAAAIGFLGAVASVRQTSGEDLTNNVTSGGTDGTIADYSSLTIYATDAAAIRNNIYQLARKLKQVNDALRLYGLLT